MSNSNAEEEDYFFMLERKMDYKFIDMNYEYFSNAGFAVQSQKLIDLIKPTPRGVFLDYLEYSKGEAPEKLKYNTSVIENIDENIRKSKLFKFILNYLYSNKDIFSVFGSLFLLAEKYTFDFYNYGVIEDDLEFISAKDPILNGLSSFIEEKTISLFNDPINPESLYPIFFEKLVNCLIDEGKDILSIKQNDELKYESLKFKMNNSMAIAYKFKAKISLDDTLIDKFAKKIPRDSEQLKKSFEGLMINLLGDKSYLESSQDYRSDLLKLINLKGFYYHFFIWRMAKKIKIKGTYKPLLSSIYHLLNYFDEPYIKLLDFIFLDELEMFDDTAERFQKELHLLK